MRGDGFREIGAEEADRAHDDRELGCTEEDEVREHSARRDASEDMRREVLPRIMAEAGRLMDGFSGGRYGALGADPSLHMTFRTGDETRSLAYLSAGTRDLAYVSLRLALVSVLAGENRPPVFFDESFASVDDDRLDAVAALLSGEGVGQVIWLSCRRAEADAAEKAGADVILL